MSHAIVKGELYNGNILTIDNRIIKGVPKILFELERPLYVTEQAYGKPLYSEQFNDNREIKRILYNTMNEGKIIIGAKNIREFIEKLKFYA